MKKKQILKSLIMILTIVFSVLSSLIVDSKLTITAHAASNYGLTIKWTEGIEWVATDEAGTNRWTNGSIKYFAENTSAGTYIKLKPGYRLDCLAADSEWADWTTISDTLYYDSWSMYGNRTITVKVISEVFEENGERYTYNGNYKESGYKLVEVDSWNCTHSFEGDDIIGYIESDPSDIYEGYRLNPTNPELLASLKTYTSDSRYKIRVGSPYVKYTGEVPDVKLNELVSKYTLYVDTHNVFNETGFYPEYGADKDNDWLLASNYRCPDKDAGADADYAGFAYYRRYYAYCKDTLSWYIVGSAHNWLGCANGDIGANEFHTKEYTHTIHKYKLVESHEYTVRLNTGNIPSSELTKLTETASTEGWTWNENGRYFSKAFVQNENNYLPGVNKFFSTNNYESVGSKVTDKYFVQDKTKNPTKVLYNWWTSASGGTDIGRGKKTYNNLYEISKDNSGIVNLYPHWMGYTTVFNYTDNAPANTAGLTVTINNSINDGMDNYLYQVYGSCFFYKGTDGTYHDYEGTNPDLKVTASIPDSNGYKYIFVGWHHKNWNYLTDGLGKLTYKNNYNIGQGKTSYSLSPHFSRVGINYNVRLNANVPDTESTLQVLHQNGISSYIYNSTSRYFSRELTYDDSQDMLSPDVYSLKGYHLISRSNWYTEKTGGNTVSAQCNNTEAEYPDWTEKNWNLTTTDGATVDLYARWQANNYKIAYNLDGGTYGKSHPTSADYDTIVTIDNPSKSGYIFAGWTITGYDSTTSGHNAATWSGEKGTSYKNLTATDGATVTFTATWKKEAPKTANLQTTGDVGIKATSHPDKTIVNIASNVQVSAVLNTGYVFKGWYNGNVKVSDDLSFIYTMPNKDTVLTAKTEIKWYTMTFDPNGGILKNPGNNLYNAEWKNGNTVSVGWNINDFCYMNGDIPTRRGYRFTGWYLGSESVYNKYGIAIKNSSLYSYDTDYHWRYDGNVTVKAGWNAINYKISYKVVTGAGSIPSQTVHYGDSFTLADGNAFTYTGHTFSHWYVRRSSDKKVFCYDGNWHTTDGSDLYGSDVSNWYPYNNSGLTFEMNNSWIRSDTDADEEFVFWGFWTADKYNIIYNLDGGTLNGKTNPDTYNIETPTFTLNNPTKTGYTFEGWTGTDIAGTSKIVTINQGSIGNRTYTATWTPIEYSIVYTKGYTNNAKDDVIQNGIKYNKDVTLISNPFTGRSYTVKYSTPTSDRDWDKVTAPAGFNGTLEFAHWNILSKTYAAGTKLKNLTTKNGDKITATAQWKDKKFILPVVSRPGYVFAGWYSLVDRKVYKANTEYTISQALTAYDNTFTAQWTAKTDTPYKVEHYKMNLDGITYTLADTDNFKDTTDTSVTPAIKTYEGFTSPSTQTVTIKGDGTTVVKYYYIRNKYTLDLNGFISSVSRPNLTEEVDGQIFIAGKATVTVNGKVLATNETDFCQMVYYGSSYKITTVPEAGYSIIGNTTVEGTMPASDKTVTITINTNKDTKYIVRHWKEKLYLDGTKTYADSSKHNTTNYFLADTDNLTGQTNRLVTPTVKTYEGFTSPSAITVRVKGDGSLIVDYYYTRNTYTLKTDDSDSNKDDQDNGIKSGNGIDSSKTNVISEGNNKKDNKKKFKYEEVVTVTTDTLSGYHWHVNDDCETIKRNLYPTGWSDHEGYRVEKWYTENGKTYGYKDQTTKFYMPAHDVKLDVNATNNSYKIIFEKNKPMNVTNPYTGAVSSASNEITGTVTDTFYIYNHANQKLPGNVYNLTGWTFKGWSLKKDYSSGYGFGWEYGTNSWSNDLSHLTTKNLDVIHMYAKWEANRYQITFNYEHNSSNPYGNLGYDEKAEAATKLTKNGADSKTATYDAKVGSLPNPTLTGATFVKWVDSKGNEYTEDTIYKITSPITLYAVWQQNTGTFAYIANGITYNNNGIGVYEATNSDGTNQFKAMTEDITLEENKFGTTMENTSYSNFTKKSKYGYVVINAGTSYAKETDTSGDSVYYSFQGWSANNYATVAGDKNAGLIHQIGYKDRLFNYAYETMANEMNTLETGYNSKDTSVADSIRAKANELYNTKELTQNNTYAIMYAVWDQFPVIKSDQVVLTINDFSAYVNENADGFEQHAYDVIKDRIINANTVKDREDGNIRDNIEIENLDEILNMMLTMYKTPGMTSSMITIRTHVSDSVGNTTYGYTTVALINNKAKQDDPIIPTVDEDGKEINTRILSAKVRSITREFYNTGYEGSSDYKSDYSAATYKNYGGLIPNSIWYKNEEYVKTINQCFDNFDNNTPEQTWYFTHDDVLSIQEYAKQHKDTPHGVEDGELTNFYNKYKSCIIQGIDAS